MGKDVCVIIAARNAAPTIAAAIRSALDEPEVVEVLVVDDGSTDDTGAVASGVEDGSGRLRVIQSEINRGPSSARNMAIAQSRAPYISILDADDVFIKGRFKRMFGIEDWDLVADNIAFIEQGSLNNGIPDTPTNTKPAILTLNTADFVLGNISRRGAPRGEMGFLKPVIRRKFLEDHELAYNESLRLGEDYELYARAMSRGALFKVIDSCGYAALVRANSLSASHSTRDLENLADADLAILSSLKPSTTVRRAIEAHEKHVRGKYRLRRFLDLKSTDGWMSAFGFALSSAANLGSVFSGILGDKLLKTQSFLHGDKAASRDEPIRYLLPQDRAATEK